MTYDAHGHLLDIQGRPADTPDVRRCKCSHPRRSHYRDRTGRPMCVGVCGCQTYREQEK